MSLAAKAKVRLIGRALRLFRKDSYRKPNSGLDIHSPTVEVEVAGSRLIIVTGIGTIEAHHVTILILDPDAAYEASPACSLLREYVKDYSADVAKKFATHITEVVVLLIETGWVDQHHLHEAGWNVLQLEHLCKACNGLKRTFEEALGRGMCLVARVGKGFAEVDAAQHVLIRDRHRLELLIRLHVLNVSLHHRSPLLEILDRHLFPGNCLLDQFRLVGGQGADFLVELLLLGECHTCTQAEKQTCGS
jgi:hypothetical protein